MILGGGAIFFGVEKRGITVTANFAREQLKALIERIERLEEEKRGISEDIKDVFAEAKANGFDVKIMRQVLRLRKKDLASRQEEETLLDLYLHALGMQPELPFAQSGSEAA